MHPPLLSICIATFKRGQYIGETLESIVSQVTPDIELVVLDGASPDETQPVMTAFVARHPATRYFRESHNSGLDQDYDKAVGMARGRYVWLMTDDDLLVPEAVSHVLGALADEPELLLVNAEIWNANFSKLLDRSLLRFSEDRKYDDGDQAKLFSETGRLTSFIGSVIMRRDVWLERERQRYYGSLFIHLGVMFQSPHLKRTKVLAEPQIRIRYGNAMWTSRGFEIWLFLWPRLIWSFDFSESSKSLICPKEPWRQLRKLVLYRAIGGYSLQEYRKHIKGHLGMIRSSWAWFVAIVPRGTMNSIAILLCLVLHRNRIVMYDIVRSAHAGFIARLATRITGL